MAEAAEESIGSVKWSVYDTATSQVLLDGEKILHTKDVHIKPIETPHTSILYDKTIELGGHFNFGLCDGADMDDAVGKGGFGLTGKCNDEKSFSWEWFTVDSSGHAHKLQESGDLSFNTKKTPNGTEINYMEFLTDVSIRVSRMTDESPFEPAWRITIFKGSVISWPFLVNGEVQSQ